MEEIYYYFPLIQQIHFVLYGDWQYYTPTPSIRQYDTPTPSIRWDDTPNPSIRWDDTPTPSIRSDDTLCKNEMN